MEGRRAMPLGLPRSTPARGQTRIGAAVRSARLAKAQTRTEEHRSRSELAVLTAGGQSSGSRAEAEAGVERPLLRSVWVLGRGGAEQRAVSGT
jgi:hypothetical protein